MSKPGKSKNGNYGGVSRRTVLKTTGIAVTAGGLATQSVAADNRPATTAQLRSESSVSKEDLRIESWDGTELGATLYIPEGDGPHPSVLMTHGWGAFRQSPLTAPRALNYAKNGYVVLTYDSRGFASSEGTVTLNGPNEIKDTQELITWLANRKEVATEEADNPWIGMDGISYAGGIQFQAAAVDDRLDALIPRITWNDMEYSLTPNGVIKVGWLSALLGLGEFNTLLDSDAELTDDLSDWYWHAVSENEVPNEALEFFSDISFAHDDEIDTPTFLMQGWNDSLFNPTEALHSYRELQDAGVDSRLLFYEGGHDLTEVTVSFDDRERMSTDAVAWMDKHVRGEDIDIPPVQNYLPQRDEWREDDSWPPEDIEHLTYHLADATRDGSNEIEQGWFFSGDEEVTYKWTVDEDIEVIGEPVIDLTIDVHGPEARLFFELWHNGSNINGMDEAYRLDSGTQEFSVTYPAIQWFLSEGDTLELNISVSNTWYLDSRDSKGVTIQPNASSISIPQRPDGDGNNDQNEDYAASAATLPAAAAGVGAAAWLSKRFGN